MKTSYTVQEGDTIYSIAEQFNCTVEDLAKWNDLLNPDIIMIGQVLNIYYI